MSRLDLAPFPRYYHLFPKIWRGHVTLNISLLWVVYHACTRTPLHQSVPEILRAYSFTNYKDMIGAKFKNGLTTLLILGVVSLVCRRRLGFDTVYVLFYSPPRRCNYNDDNSTIFRSITLGRTRLLEVEVWHQDLTEYESSSATRLRCNIASPQHLKPACAAPRIVARTPTSAKHDTMLSRRSLSACKIWRFWDRPIYSEVENRRFPRYGWCPPKFMWFTWPDHVHFRDSRCHPWSSNCYHQPIYQKVWKLYLYIPTTKTRKAIQNSENEVV